MMDAHVQEAHRVFRGFGFTIAAMQFPRCVEALAALKRFNGLPADFPVPFGWRFFPNAWCRDNWRAAYGELAA